MPDEDRLAVVLGQDLHVGSDVAYAGRADEDAAQPRVLPGQVEIRLEARDLTPVGVAIDADVDKTEVLTV